MAKTFDPNRVLPGTIELVRDANGNYTTKVVGLETINSLSLPEISTSAAVTKTVVLSFKLKTCSVNILTVKALEKFVAIVASSSSLGIFATIL